MVTTSTESCVSARSGAEKSMKRGAIRRPTTPVRISAVTRDRCRNGVASAAIIRTAQVPVTTGSAGSVARVPGSCAPPVKAQSAAPAMASTARVTERLKLPLCRPSVRLRARAASGSTTPSKIRFASGRGAASHSARRRG
jgi:hypothetical protein